MVEGSLFRVVIEIPDLGTAEVDDLLCLKVQACFVVEILKANARKV